MTSTQRTKNANGAGLPPPLMDEAIPPEDQAAAPVPDLMAEALSSPDEFGGALAASPTAFAVRKPGPDEWFRIHPDFNPSFALYERSGGEGRSSTVYLVRRALIPLFGKAARPCTLRLAVTVQGQPFIWALKHAFNGFGETWAESRFTVVKEAIARWIAIEAGAGVYDVIPPERPDIFPEPRWPEGTPNDWLNKGFAGRIVDRPDHEVILQRRGAAL
jgi:hypothetical protein